MRPIYYFLILLFSSLLCTPQLLAQSSVAKSNQQYFQGQLYIKFKQSFKGSNTPHQKLKNNSATRSLIKNARVQQIERILTPSLQRAARHYLDAHPRSPLRHHLSSLNRVYRIRYAGNISAPLFAAKLARRSDIEYATPRYYHKLLEQPNDPLQSDHLAYHNFYQAWDQSKSDSDIIIGIIDSGVDYTHEDLRNETWINQDEIPGNWQDSVDANGDGQIYAAEIHNYLQNNKEDYNGDGTINLQDALASSSPLTTGGDTDNNGYGDDLFGWDFWQSGIPGQNRVQDNDPIGDYSSHGTHVAGIAGAETNNTTGVPGTGYNARLMAVKAGGIQDISETQPNENKIIGFGYEGLLYAAINGADVLNASWGGSAFSEFEIDIIETITSMGTLVIAASGNSGEDRVIYPAAFDQTLGVGSIETSGQLSTYSNYGYSLDVLATGTSIYGTMPNNEYAQQTGTSMSTPIVSGLAALVKGQYPDWSSQRIGQQIRVTAEPLEETGERRYQLGHGSIDASRALTQPLPGLKVISSDFVNENGDKLGIGEPGRLQFKIVNVGEGSNNLNLELESRYDNISISNTQKSGLTLAHNDTVEFHFDLQIQSDYNLSQSPTFFLQMESTEEPYSDFHRFVYENILFDIIAANRVYTSFAANGTIGFTDPLNGTGGVGFQPRDTGSDSSNIGPNLLFEGGLVTSFDGTIRDAVRTSNGKVSRDFDPLSTFRVFTPGTISKADGRTHFKNSSSSQAFYSRAEYDLRTYAFDESSINQTIYVKYDIKNTSFDNRQLRNVYVGLFNDWDLGSVTQNSTGFIESDSLMFVYDQAEEVPYYVGVAPMNEVSGQLAINNAISSAPDSLVFGIYDGFSNSEKKIALKAGNRRTEVSQTDVSTMVASGPYHIGPRATVTVGFIYAYGTTLQELRDQVKAARNRDVFETSSTGVHLETDDEPDQTRIYQNYPNPFNGSTNIRIDLANPQHVKAVVYNVVGQKVATLRNEQMSAGLHTIRFQPDDLASGLYLVNVQTNTTQKTLKINFIK